MGGKYAVLFENSASWIMAHEAGHLMGLEDKYRDQKQDDGTIISVPELGACRTYASRLDFCPSLKEQASCLLLQSRLRSLSPPSMAAFLRYRSALSSGAESTTRLPCCCVAKMLT